MKEENDNSKQFTPPGPKMPNLDRIIRSIDRLEPISPIAVEVVGLLENEDYSSREIANLVSQDPALAANVLRMVNSAYYGLKYKTESIMDALSLLGAKQVAELILIFSLNQTYSAGRQSGWIPEEGDLWQTAVVTANLAKKISKQSGIGNPGRIFTAALVRDIGKIVLYQFVTESAKEIRALAETEAIGFNDAEQRVLGIGHAELGARVAERWGFPEAIVQIIRDHHSDRLTNGPEHQETAIVQCAEDIYLRFEGDDDTKIGNGTKSDGAVKLFLSEEQYNGLMYSLMKSKLDMRLFLDEMQSVN